MRKKIESYQDFLNLKDKETLRHNRAEKKNMKLLEDFRKSCFHEKFYFVEDPSGGMESMIVCSKCRSKVSK